MTIISQEVRNIVNSIKNKPEDWTVGHYYITHNKTNIQIWTANGAFYVQPYNPDYYCFNLVEKVLIWRGFKKMKPTRLGEIE